MQKNVSILNNNTTHILIFMFQDTCKLHVESTPFDLESALTLHLLTKAFFSLREVRQKQKLQFTTTINGECYMVISNTGLPSKACFALATISSV